MDLYEQRDIDWRPPHCPNRNCLHHRHFLTTWCYKKAGFYARLTVPLRVQRYRCRTCGVTFSTQSFSTTYWQKRPDLTAAVFMKSVGCMSARQMARELDVSPETICRHLARLGRHAALLHCQAWDGRLVGRTLVVDGFETFERSQYHPFHLNVAVEPETDFFVFFTDSELRRKGRMTAQQRRRRQQLEEKLGRPDPKAIERAMAELLEQGLRYVDRPIVLSDEHPAYPRAIRRLGRPVQHQTTHSKEPRTSHNPLWVVNLLDLLIRHSQSNHKRETIAFSKRRQGAIYRLLVLLLWRNYVKSQREKRPGTTPAMARGMTDHPWSIREILGRRLFPGRIELPERWKQYYDGAIQTRGQAVNRRHDLEYAY